MRNLLPSRSAGIIAAVALVLLPASALAQFDPGLLIADDTFGNAKAFESAEGIQRFLEVRGSLLANTSMDFLKMLREPADIDLKNKLDDPNANLGRLRTAAELIYDASKVAQINPQVILVTLQKEQSLIDGKYDGAALQRRLDRALGFACPDSGGCGDLFLGFYFQMFGNLDHDGSRYLGAARSLAKSFYTDLNGVRVGRGPLIDASGNAFGTAPKVRAARKGDTITLENTQGPPNNAPATQTFLIKGAATAALYRYTPHVYNGNYNFWRFFHQWFKYGNGSLIKLSGSTQVFFVDNGQRRQVTGAVMTLRKLDVTRAFNLSQAEFDEYSLAKPLPPPEGTVVAPSVGTARYIVENSQLHQLSDFVIAQRKLDMVNVAFLPDNEVSSYEIGEAALPPEGTLMKTASDPTVYVVQSKQLRPISGFVFVQRGYRFPQVAVAPDAEFAAHPKATPLPPLDGTLAKSAASPLIYYVALGQKFPIPYFVFKLRNFKFSQVVTLGQDEIDNLSISQHFAPPDGKLLKAKGQPTVYYVEAGSLHYITGFIFKQRGFKFTSVIEILPEELALIPTGDPLFLEDGTLIKVQNDPTVYLIEEGKKSPLTAAGFKARGFQFSEVKEVPREEADRYQQGPVISG